MPYLGPKPVNVRSASSLIVDGNLTAGQVNSDGAVIATGAGTFGDDVNITGDVDVTGAITPTNGIYLGGTGAANLLDDYEEGTWTPSDGSGAGLSISISGTSTYEKVGNVVIATCRLTYPSTGSTAQAKVGGLPFTSKSTGANMQSAIISITSLGTAVTGLVLNNTDDVVFTNFSDGTQTNSNFSGKQIGLTAVYIAG